MSEKYRMILGVRWGNKYLISLYFTKEFPEIFLESLIMKNFTDKYRNKDFKKKYSIVRQSTILVVVRFIWIWESLCSFNPLSRVVKHMFWKKINLEEELQWGSLYYNKQFMYSFRRIFILDFPNKYFINPCFALAALDCWRNRTEQSLLTNRFLSYVAGTAHTGIVGVLYL